MSALIANMRAIAIRYEQITAYNRGCDRTINAYLGVRR